MLSRRIFLKGLAGAAALLSTRAFANGVRAWPAENLLTIDSVETPVLAAQQARRHVRLSGTQLERYNLMRSLFSSASELRVEANLDHAGLVLLDTALNDAGRALASPVSRGSSYSVVVKAA